MRKRTDPMPPAHAEPSPPPGPGRAGPPGVIELPRKGRKPLRFRGRLACRECSSDPAIGDCEIALWYRQDRRIAVSVRRRPAGRPEVEADAAIVPDLDAAFGWFEALCAETGMPDTPMANASPEAVLAFLERRWQDRAWRDRLGLMAARTLDRWQKSWTHHDTHD